MELRHCLIDGDCAQFKADGDAGKFSGYAAVFGSVDSHGEVFLPGAFAESLRKRTPGLFYQHPEKYGVQPQPIGVITTIKEDDRGLYVEGQINTETRLGRETWALMKQGALSGLSVGFRVAANDVRFDADRQALEIMKADLHEVSVVADPANDSARILEIKSRLSTGDLITVRDLEGIFKEIGFSRREAKKLCSCVKQAHASGVKPEQPDESDNERDAALEKFKSDVRAAIETWRDANRDERARHLQFNL